MEPQNETLVTTEQSQTASEEVKKYVHLLSYAILGQDEKGKMTALLCDENGDIKHIDNKIPITFSESLPADRIWTTTLFDKGTSKPFHIINVLAEFEKDWFETHKENIPSFKDLEWDELRNLSSQTSMNPTDPPRTVQKTVQTDHNQSSKING